MSLTKNKGMVSGTATYKRPVLSKTESVTYLGKDPNGVLFVANKNNQVFAYTGKINPDNVGDALRTEKKYLKAFPDIHLIQGAEHGKPTVLYDQSGGKDQYLRQEGKNDVLKKVEAKNPKPFYSAKKAA